MSITFLLSVLVLSCVGMIQCHDRPWESKQECLPSVRAPFLPYNTFADGGNRHVKAKTIPEILPYMNCGFDHAFGQNSEDHVVFRRFFNHEKYRGNGFFVEMGGLDGLLFSNTFLLEHCLGWNGML